MSIKKEKKNDSGRSLIHLHKIAPTAHTYVLSDLGVPESTVGFSCTVIIYSVHVYKSRRKKKKKRTEKKNTTRCVDEQSEVKPCVLCS